MDYEALGRRIRQERVARKWTQAKLANEIHLSISFLGHVERGSRKASMETVVAIANTLEVPLESLLSDSLHPLPKSDPYERLNPRQRNALRQMVQLMSKDLDMWGEE